jgi:predicted transcriptional regulator
VIKTSLITHPLGERQQWALAALNDLTRPSTCGEVAAAIKRRFRVRQFGQVSELLSSLVARGLVKRCRGGRLWLYSRVQGNAGGE